MPQVTDQLALTLLLVCRAAGLAICPQVHARQHATSGACQRHGHTRSAPEGACWPIGRAGEDLGHLAAALHPIDELLYAMAASRLAVQHKTYQQTVRDARLPLVAERDRAYLAAANRSANCTLPFRWARRAPSREDVRGDDELDDEAPREFLRPTCGLRRKRECVVLDDDGTPQAPQRDKKCAENSLKPQAAVHMIRHYHR